MTDRASDTTMHIGELAERTGLSLRTIRHYDEVGLLPAASRTDGGFRVYAMGDVARLNLIKKMKPLGFTLEEMAELLEILGLLEDAAPIASSQRNALREFRERALTQRAKMARNLAQADDLITLMDS